MATTETARAALSPQDLVSIARLAQDYPSVSAMEAAVRAAHTAQRFSVTEVLRLHAAGLISDDEAREYLGWGQRQPPGTPARTWPRPIAPLHPCAVSKTPVVAAVGASPLPPPSAPANARCWPASHRADAVIRFCWAIIWRFTAVLILVLLIDGAFWLLLNRVEIILATLAVMAIGFLTHAWRRRGFGGALWRAVAAGFAVAWGAAGLIAPASAYAIAAGFALCVLEPAVVLAAGRRGSA
jgi:hypothetical protein